MRRSTVRLFVFLVLALLGAPVAMHVLLHDLHDEHHEVAEVSHGDHEHPVVSSAAPQVPTPAQTALPLIVVSPSIAWTRMTATDRNVISFGALRIDEDVGLQPLLSTFLI